MDLHDVLGQHLGASLGGKVGFADASYQQDADTYPWVCGTCKHYNWTADDHGSCELVLGPHEDNSVAAHDTCRLYAPKPFFATVSQPVSNEGSSDGSEEQDGQWQSQQQ